MTRMKLPGAMVVALWMVTASAAEVAPPLVSAPAAAPAPAEEEAGRAETGGAGLHRVRSAFIADQSLSVGVRAGFFRVPALSASGGVDEYRATSFGASWAPLPRLELSATLKSATLEQTASAAQHYYLVNDFWLRAKGSWTAWEGALAVGVEASLRLPPPVLRADPLWLGASPGLGGVASYNLARHGAPLVFHLNTGFFFDESVRFDDGTGDRSRRLALDITTYNQWRSGLGVEGRFRLGGVGLRPFVEYTLDAALGAKGSSPMRLTPGLRVLPWRGLFLDGVVEFGLTHPSAVGVLPVPGWQAVVAVGYQAGLGEADPQVVERVIEREKQIIKQAAPTRGAVTGKVVDVVTLAPVPDAVVMVKGRDRQLTNADGTFTVAELEPGPAWLSVSRAGFAAREATATVVAGDKAAVQVALTALPPEPPAPMTIRGTVLSETEAAVEASVLVPSAGVMKKADKGGSFELTVPSGPQTIEVTAPGFLPQGRQLHGRPGDNVVLDIVLRPVPKQTLVVLKKEKIEIKKQVHFAAGKDVILPDSAPLLDQLAGLLMEQGKLKLIRIEGHTDSDGDDAFNMTLSEKRASSVMRALLERGVNPARLKAVGFGETKPIGDNKKPAGKAQNRRVEFMIEEQE